MRWRKSVVLVLSVLVLMACASPVWAEGSKKKLELEAGVSGGTLYQISYAYSVVVNKYSKDLEILTVETSGSAAGLLKTYEQPKDRILSASNVPVLEARQAIPPFDKAYKDIRAIGNFTLNLQTFITLDPDIKNLKDLSGKRVGLGPKPNITGKNAESILKKGFGLSDKTKFFFMNWPQLKDALLDGSIDAMILGVTVKPKGAWTPVPVFQEISSARKTVHFLGVPEDGLKKASEIDKIDYPFINVPKDIIAPGMPAEDTPAWTDGLGLFAHKDLPDETAYELASLLYEHCEEMAETTAAAKGTYKEMIPKVSMPDDMIHPGALKFYREKKLR